LLSSLTRLCDTLHFVFPSTRLVLRPLIRKEQSYAPGHSLSQPGPSLIESWSQIPPGGLIHPIYTATPFCKKQLSKSISINSPNPTWSPNSF
jgi:hypothetical protein